MKSRTGVATVLLVDDDSQLRQTIGDGLLEAGYDVIAAPDTITGLRQLEANPQIDICLVDLVMPSTVPDGVEFARSVRSFRPHLPIVLMTGYYAAALKAVKLATHLIYKPVDLDVLVGEIERHLPPPQPEDGPAA